MHVEIGTAVAAISGILAVQGAALGVIRWVLARERERMEAVMDGQRKLDGSTYETKADASKYRHEIRSDVAGAQAEVIARLDDVLQQLSDLKVSFAEMRGKMSGAADGHA